LKPLRIGTRASALARWQAESVRAQLAALGCAAELVLIRTSGDRDLDTPLRLLGGKGVFTKEIESALLENRVDLAVHSMKDLPTALPDGQLLSPALDTVEIAEKYRLQEPTSGKAVRR